MDDERRAAVAQALGRIPSGLFIVSARDDAGREGAFLASWVMQAGFTPPALSVGLGRDRAIRSMMDAPDARFAVSVIAAAERQQLGPYYKGVEVAVDALEGHDIERSASGLPVVRGALAWMECRRIGSMEVGDHCIVVGEVVAARAGRDDAPAVHTRSDGLSY